MCQVQRVTNTCGHRNDHVSLNCHFGKTGRHLAVPISDPNSKRSTVNTATTTTVTSRSAGTAGNSHSIEDRGGVAAVAAGGEKNNETAAVDYGGFHAWTRPYCIFASIRRLDSPAGFMCMVEGCEKAD